MSVEASAAQCSTSVLENSKVPLECMCQFKPRLVRDGRIWRCWSTAIDQNFMSFGLVVNDFFSSSLKRL